MRNPKRKTRSGRCRHQRNRDGWPGRSDPSSTISSGDACTSHARFCSGIRRQRSNDGKNTVSGYLSKPPPQGYVGISYGSADDEKEEEEGELDFAEQDEERAYGHEMRPFGVPNPNPYHPAKRGRGGS